LKILSLKGVVINMLKNSGTQIVETERLILRKFDYADSEDMLRYWASDPYVQSMYSEPVYTTKKEVEGLLDKYISAYEKPDYYRWAIILKASNECIGQIAFFLVNSVNHFGEIEYCVGREFQRRGFATEATNAVIRFGFEKINFHKVQICHKRGNIASQGVIKKCGFIYEGALRDFFYMDGKYVDRLYYSILREEWNQQRLD
jgi:ribosomal-protein-alanine N-acetyltransferase